MTVRIALGGAAGRMGAAIQEAIKEREGMELALTCDPEDGDLQSIADYDQAETDCDIYIDFTAPEAVLDNVEAAAGHGLDCIIGTTGWYEAEDQVRELAAAQDVRILYSPNFSTGINALFGALEYLAAVLGDQGFDASIVEKHHTGKTDAPSGTAHEMAQILLEGMQHKDEVVEAREGAHQSGELDIASVRVGDEPGEHEVTFTAPGHSEKLVLRHQSSGQAVFAEGVLRAVDWLATTDIGPGLYTFREDVLE